MKGYSLQIGLWRANGERKISPGRGVRTLAGGKSASALAAPGILKKISEPRRSDRKRCNTLMLCFLPPLRGSILFCRIPGAAPALRAYPRLVFFHPLRGLRIPRAFSPTKTIYCAEGGFFQNVADISILYKIFGTRVAPETKNTDWA